MSIRLKLSVLTMFAGLAAFSGCGDDSDSDDPSNGGEAGDSSTTGGKAGSTGGKAGTTGGNTGTTGGTDGGSTDPGAGGDGAVGGANEPGAGGAPSEGGVPNEGGETSTGGTSTGGTGSGGAPTGTCEYPQCLADLQANCVPEGECTQQINLDDPLNPSFAMCWDNGVKAGFGDFDADTGSGTFEFQMNGDVCYSIDFTAEATTGASSLVYKDASGATVATVETDPDTESQTITCVDSGQVVVYTPESCPDPEPGSEQPDPSECAMGTCALD